MKITAETAMKEIRLKINIEQPSYIYRNGKSRYLPRTEISAINTASKRSAYGFCRTYILG